MTEEELARTLCRAHVEGVGGWGEGAWLAVARRARELLCAQPQPVPLPPGTKRLHILFDAPPGHEGGRFVEVETDDGYSTNARAVASIGPYPCFEGKKP